MSNAYSLLRELRRRKVFRGAAIYLVAAWLVLQVLEFIVEPAGLPAWTMRVAFYVAIIGLPLAVFLGWRYEFGEHGLVVTKAAQASGEEGTGALGASDYFAVAAMTIVSVAVAWRVIPTIIEETPEPAAVEEISILRNSIAVIPFREPGSTGDGFLADGLVDTVTFMLAQVDGGWTLFSESIHIDPKLDFLRNDPRYLAIVQRLTDTLAEHRRWYYENKDAPLL